MKFILRLSILNFLIISVLIFRGLYLNQKPISLIPVKESSLSVTNSTPSITQPPRPTVSIQSQLSQHNSVNDCWISFNNNLYDVTTYLNLHPGGSGSIAKYCGRSINTAFNTKDKSPPQPHSQAALKILFSLMVKK